MPKNNNDAITMLFKWALKFLKRDNHKPTDQLLDGHEFALKWIRPTYYGSRTMEGTSNDGFKAVVEYSIYYNKWYASIEKCKGVRPTIRITSTGFKHLHDAAMWCEKKYRNADSLQIHRKEVQELDAFERLISKQRKDQ